MLVAGWLCHLSLLCLFAVVVCDDSGGGGDGGGGSGGGVAATVPVVEDAVRVGRVDCVVVADCQSRQSAITNKLLASTAGAHTLEKSVLQAPPHAETLPAPLFKQRSRPLDGWEKRPQNEKQTARSQSPRDYTATFLEKDEAKELEHCTFQPNVSSTQNRCMPRFVPCSYLSRRLLACRQAGDVSFFRLIADTMYCFLGGVVTICAGPRVACWTLLGGFVSPSTRCCGRACVGTSVAPCPRRAVSPSLHRHAA